MSTSGWIGVDLDGTLAEYHGWVNENHIGDPIPAMVERVKRWLADGVEVRIFTARVGLSGEYSTESRRYANQDFVEHQEEIIRAWCKEHIGQELLVTAMKDFKMVEMWDDRCVQVIPNKGIPIKELS